MRRNGLLFAERLMEMMAKCGEDRKRECGAMMQEMMKGGCCQPEEKWSSVKRTSVFKAPG